MEGNNEESDRERASPRVDARVDAAPLSHSTCFIQRLTDWEVAVLCRALNVINNNNSSSVKRPKWASYSKTIQSGAEHNSGADQNSAAEGDGDRGRYSLLERCASQSSLDESSQRRGGGEGGEGGEGGAAAAHAVALLGALARLRRDAALCDVRLHAAAGGEGGGEGGAPVNAHRAVLAASSPYFRAMFTGFDERDRPAVTIRGVEPAALAAIVDYIYDPDSLHITEDNVQGILSGASLLQVGGARAAACRFLAAALAPDNALGIRAFAELHACADLAAVAAAYVERHFTDVLAGDEFLALDADALARLLDSDRLAVPDEEAALDAALRWLAHDPAARRPHLGALLEHVRLPLLPRDALVQRAAAEPLASAPLRVKDLLIEALTFHLLRPERRAQGDPRRGGVGAGRRALAAGGAAADAPVPGGRGGGGRAAVRGGRVQRHAAGALGGRVRRGDGLVGAGPAAAGAPLDARRGGGGAGDLRGGRVRRRDGAELGGDAGHARGRVAGDRRHEHAPVVGGRGRAGGARVRGGRVRRRVAAVPAHGGGVRAGGGPLGAGGGDGGAAVGRGRGCGGRRAVRGGRARRAGGAPQRGAVPPPLGLGAGRPHGARASQRRRRRIPRPPLRGGRGRRRRQPRVRGGVRPQHGAVVGAAGAHGGRPLVRRRRRGRAGRLTRAARAARAPLRQRARLPPPRRRRRRRRRRLRAGGRGLLARLPPPPPRQPDARVPRAPRRHRAAPPARAAPAARARRLVRHHRRPAPRRAPRRRPAPARARAAARRGGGPVRDRLRLRLRLGLGRGRRARPAAGLSEFPKRFLLEKYRLLVSRLV